MSEKTPSVEQRKAALDRNMKDYSEHLRKQGQLPSQREVEKLHISIAENADRKKGW